MFRVRAPLYVDELLEKAFSRASKAADAVRSSLRTKSKLKKARIVERERVKVAADIIIDNLSKSVNETGRYEDLDDFYKELVSLLVDVDRMRKALATIRNRARLIERLKRCYLVKLSRCKDPEEASRLRREAFGRFSSILREAAWAIEYLNECSKKLRDLPVVKRIPTVIIAGAPNVGKSSILRCLTGSEPEIASYPFTTKQLLLGYFEHDHREIQVIDTPGLLDRPLSERNEIERMAIAALRHLANAIVFVADFSGHSGYPIESQLRILDEIIESFGKERLVCALNKVDLLTEEERIRARMELSKRCENVVETIATSCSGVDELRARILKKLDLS